MKNNPFPQAQMLDSQGVLHEWHGAVHNPSCNPFVLDNLLKSIAIRPSSHAGNSRRIQAPYGLCADLARSPAPATSAALRACYNPPNHSRIVSIRHCRQRIDRKFSRHPATFFDNGAPEIPARLPKRV
jgi:hypothetical protein